MEAAINTPPNPARGFEANAASERSAALLALRQAVEVAAAGQSTEPVERLPARAFHSLPVAELRSLLDSLLLARHADQGLERLRQNGCLGALLPELTKIVGFGDGESHKDVWRHTKQVVIQSIPRLAVRWAALLHDIGKPRTRSVAADGSVHFFHHAEEGARMFDRLERRLGLFAAEPELSARIRFLVLQHQRAHQYDEAWTDSAVRRFAREMDDALSDLMALSRADMTTKRREKRRRFLFQLKHLQERIEKLAAEDARVPALPKGLGDGLMQRFGIPPSRRIGEIRKELEAAVEGGEIAAQQSAETYLDFVASQPARFGIEPERG